MEPQPVVKAMLIDRNGWPASFAFDVVAWPSGTPTVHELILRDESTWTFYRFTEVVNGVARYVETAKPTVH